MPATQQTEAILAVFPKLLDACIEADRLYSTLRHDKQGYMLKANCYGNESIGDCGVWIGQLREAIDEAQRAMSGE